MKLDARSNLGSNEWFFEQINFDMTEIELGKPILHEKERKRRDKSPKKTPNFMHLENL